MTCSRLVCARRRQETEVSMERLQKRPPWWAWFSLLGLEIPTAALAWAYALSRMQRVVVAYADLYLFLFVAVWCVVIFARLQKVFRSKNEGSFIDECVSFTQKHWFLFAVIALACSLLSLWMLLWVLGVYIFQLAMMPALFSLCFLIFTPGAEGRPCFSFRFLRSLLCAAFAFVGGACIPACFYAPYGSFLTVFAGPTGYLLAFILLSGMIRKQWQEEEAEAEQSPESDMGELLRMVLLTVFVVFCLIAAHKDALDAWIYYGLGMAGAFMFTLDRIKRRLPPLMLYTLSWLSFALAMCISGLMAEDSNAQPELPPLPPSEMIARNVCDAVYRA